MSALLLFPARAMPPGSPASRRCYDCAELDRLGTYGPPGRGLVAYPGGTRLAELDALWFCSFCSASRWTAWRNPGRVERRRLEVWAEVARRRAQLDKLERRGEGLSMGHHG